MWYTLSISLLALLEAALIASSLSLDAFTAGFAYGTNKTKLPMLSVQIINLVCSATTGLSLLLGVILKPYLPRELTFAISFTILLVIGLLKLLDSVTKSIIRKHNNISKKINGSLFNFKFILCIYADPDAADIDSNKSISSPEAVLLALSLSLDGIATGFGAALADVNGTAVFLWSLITNVVFLLSGHFIGRKIASKTPINISWMSGAIFIGLAISKLFY